jgi:hypothetical protein
METCVPCRSGALSADVDHLAARLLCLGTSRAVGSYGLTGCDVSSACCGQDAEVDRSSAL